MDNFFVKMYDFFNVFYKMVIFIYTKPKTNIMANTKQNEIAEAINYLVDAVDNSDLHGPNKMCGMIGVSMTEAVYTLALNIGRIADVMEKQQKGK